MMPTPVNTNGNNHPKRCHTHHLAITRGMSELEIRLEKQPDKRWKYRLDKDGNKQDDETLAKEIENDFAINGRPDVLCNASMISKLRRDNYPGGFVPSQRKPRAASSRKKARWAMPGATTPTLGEIAEAAEGARLLLPPMANEELKRVGDFLFGGIDETLKGIQDCLKALVPVLEAQNDEIKALDTFVRESWK